MKTSSKAGRTRTFNFYRVGKTAGPSFVLVDSPGYGSLGRGKDGELLDRYIAEREQLKRIYLLINSGHGVTEYDAAMLSHLSDRLGRERPSVSLEVVLTKGDTLIQRPSAASVVADIRYTIKRMAPIVLGPILLTSVKPQAVGITELRQSIAEVCGD